LDKDKGPIKDTAKQFNLLSLLFYLGMGWTGVAIIDQLYNLLPREGFWWLLAGGLLYTGGTIFFVMKSIPYTHTIWHLYVVVGSVCVFISIYGFVF
jgi:hemolysin III